MKNIFLLILLIIFLYIICNRCIEKFSVGGQSIEKTPINISGSLTLSYIDKCEKSECIKIYNNFMRDCKKKLDPNNPDPDCCQQINNFYPIYDICSKQYEVNIFPSEGKEYGKNVLKKNYDICNPPPLSSCPKGQKWSSTNNKCEPSCDKGQKWSSTKNKCEYQCRCIELFPSDVCNSDIEKNCNLATEAVNCSSKGNPGRCAWHD